MTGFVVFDMFLSFLLFDHKSDRERQAMQYLRAHERLTGLNWIERSLCVTPPRIYDPSFIKLQKRGNLPSKLKHENIRFRHRLCRPSVNTGRHPLICEVPFWKSSDVPILVFGAKCDPIWMTPPSWLDLTACGNDARHSSA